MSSSRDPKLEPHPNVQGDRLNSLRAAVLGANDGIVATAGLVVGVAGATSDRAALVTAGLAGLVSGALSMASGEYVSVSTQRDTELALLAQERRELEESPQEELEELAELYEAKGLSRGLAKQVAVELTEKDAFRAHAETELGIDPDQTANPVSAAVSSAGAFTLGALLPFAAILTPASIRIWLTFVAVALALALTGFLSARAGAASPGRAIVRNVVGGVLAMAVTYTVGRLVGGPV